ncbi:hypothetical protein [Deinococcus ficus]|uniref:hypothetical protein n=1 Tax=Deinococcus ficus TaxID=317577 RepID=UPI00174B86C7|nr:hypothetical protein [Deinococcus ficus]GHF90355.1 hypothetical protein GCM10017782_29330 [Deinococcus ficus]
MDRNFNRTDLKELNAQRVPAVNRPIVTATPLDRMRNALALRPALARTISDGMIVLAVCAAGLGAVIGFQRVTVSQRTPLAGMAELRAQVLTLPPAAGPGDAPEAAVPAQEQTPASTSKPGTAAAQVPAVDDQPSRLGGPPGSVAATPALDSAGARPITGEARKVVLRLTRAAGYIIPESAMDRPTATLDIARMMAGVGRLVTPRVLEALQASPGNTQFLADFAVTLRGPPLDPAEAVAALSSPARTPAAAAPVSTPRPLDLHKGSEEIASHTAPAAAPVASEATPAPTAPASGEVASDAPRDLVASLDDPLPVNWLQAMTEQAVTPLTPRN